MTPNSAGAIHIPSQYHLPLSQSIKTLQDYKRILTSNLEKDVTAFLETALTGAIFLDISDLHYEPKEEIKLRARIDGLLQEIITIPEDFYKKIVSRVKLMSGIKLNITQKPQDGRFTISLEGLRDIETRVSAIPTNFGESIVIRILDPENVLSVDHLGLRTDLLALLQEQSLKPNGMILATGPTGSGKTTTLYALMDKINSPEIKIITIEDPIEYKIKGVTQTQVEKEKGYDFENGLKAIVRQDPDVILVGEIRDAGTCQIAIQAALTGHLVLTTLHTNDAIGAISRLMALGEKKENISPALNLIIAQRLVRRVCPKCAKMEKIPNSYLKKFQANPSPALKTLLPTTLSENTLVPFPQKCEYCNFTGYKGRVGLYEMLLVDDEVKNAVLKDQTIIDIKNIAYQKGFVDLEGDGIIKILQGVTTIEELERIAGV
ncbi:MAG TPA: GspE/PulE family protein [Candidatus Pacearchaeota archaeon]|nr:GspE/PulE family protein [Candidatus Pacearchaeota archaeon]